MTIATRDRAAAVALGVPALLEALSQFCDLNSDHITTTSTVSIDLQYGWSPKVHMRAGANAARAVLFGLDTIEDPHVLVCQNNNSWQVYIQGRFEGVPMELVACSDETDRAVHEYVDWAGADVCGYVQISPATLVQIAEHTS